MDAGWAIQVFGVIGAIAGTIAAMIIGLLTSIGCNRKRDESGERNP
jgi:hypothetical protein